MKRFTVNSLVTLTLFSLVYFGNHYVQSQMGRQAKQNIPFNRYSLADGIALATINQQLILANYYAIWCPSCRKLDVSILSNTEFANLISDKFVFVSIDEASSEGKAFAKKFSLLGFPRVLVLNHHGEKLDELPLSFDPKEYESNLQRILKAYQ